jgi:phosphonate transport system permease protein
MSEHDRGHNDSPAHPNVPRWLPPLLSLLVPGSGQFLLGYRTRGVSMLAAILGLGVLITWQGSTGFLAALVLIWLWGVWDTYRLSGDRKISALLPALAAAVVIYGMAMMAVEARPARLITGWPSMTPYLKALTQPELFTQATEDRIGATPFQIPCVDPLPPPAKSPTENPRITVSTPCGSVGDAITITGEGFLPNVKAKVRWINSIGDEQWIFKDGEMLEITADDQGNFQTSFQVPQAVPLIYQPAPGETQSHLIRVEQQDPYGPLVPTQTLSLVVEKIGETVALAFMATILGLIFALPVSFMAARNLMWGNPVTRAIYYVVRTFLNIVRSIETLMWAIVFAVWVGLGPFGGMLALMFHTIAALGKLYSEAIESIDPGPIEAVRATGASGPQVVVYGVLPQIVPSFLSFTLYRWDINVRMSTVIGLISDAGLGFLVIQWIRLNRLRSMATAIIAIVLVVAILDYVSGWLRERVIAGTPVGKRASPVRRYATTGLLVVGFAAAFVWSWNVSRINLVDFIEGAPTGLKLAKSFAIPEMFTRPTEEHTVSATLPVPCSAADGTSPHVNDSQVDLSLSCGDVGDPLVINGHDLPPNSDVSVRWALSDGAYLRVKEDCCTTDSAGNLTLDTRISPLMEVDPTSDRAEPGRVDIVWKEVIGGPQLSEPFHQVANLSLVTLLMALLATTAGSFFAVPLSFFAARNIMGVNRIGRTIYYGFRSLFNLWRSIEPMILALIAAAWVGVGPFAGVLALAINNIPNLGKLFSETIEDIDTGPVEAITATGANRLQTLIFAVIPQLVPKFLAFILYQWDINIRMSTVIGYVGGGGIGQYFRVQVQLNQYAAAGMAVWAIVIMVWSMDYFSARTRERLT